MTDSTASQAPCPLLPPSKVTGKAHSHSPLQSETEPRGWFWLVRTKPFQGRALGKLGFASVRHRRGRYFVYPVLFLSQRCDAWCHVSWSGATSMRMTSQHTTAGGAEREKGQRSVQASLSHQDNTETFHLQTPCDTNNKDPYD